MTCPRAGRGRPPLSTRTVIVPPAGSSAPITGLRATIAARDVFVLAERVADLAPGRVQFAGEQVDLGRFEHRPDEVLLGKDVLDRQLICLA